MEQNDEQTATSATVTSVDAPDTQIQGTAALDAAQAAVDGEVAAANPNVDGGATAVSSDAESTASTVDSEEVSDCEPRQSAIESVEIEIERLGTALTEDLRAAWEALKAHL